MQVAKNVTNQNHRNGKGGHTLVQVNRNYEKGKLRTQDVYFFLCIIYLNIDNALLKVGFPEE